jgi:2-iminobutanoate/2-iminopropanoate deaminase
MRRAVATIGVFLAGLAVGSFTLGVKAAAVRKYINLPGRPIVAPFSDGVLVGDTLYLAGRIGLDPSGKPPADPVAEARLALDGIKTVLAEAGMTTDDVVSVQVFCTDLSLFETWNGVYRGYFGKDMPARAFIGAGSLLRGGRFEIQAMAVKR